MQYRIIDQYNMDQNRNEPNSFWSVCSLELSKIFTDINNDDDLLKKCYSRIRNRDHEEMFLQEIVTGIPKLVLNKDNIDPGEFIKNTVFSTDISNPYFIVNNVGSGKTTFISYFF